jgi:hypothetical protein
MTTNDRASIAASFDARKLALRVRTDEVAGGLSQDKRQVSDYSLAPRVNR